jgi:predicted nucleic acid-binding protein
MAAFHRLRDYELYYNDISILEALWKIVKTIRGAEEEIARIVEGVRAVRESLKYAPIDEEALRNALYMYRLGHSDMIDNLLYSIAVSRSLRLLTVDRDLVEFVARHGLPRDALATPEELE